MREERTIIFGETTIADTYTRFLSSLLTRIQEKCEIRSKNTHYIFSFRYRDVLGGGHKVNITSKNLFSGVVTKISIFSYDLYCEYMNSNIPNMLEFIVYESEDIFNGFKN